LTAEAACDEVEAKIKSAHAAREESMAGLKKARADVTAAQARVTVAAAGAQSQRSLLAYKDIVAPYDGIVTERYVHTGHLIKPGQGNPQPLFVLVRSDRVRIFVEVPESDAAYIYPESEYACHATIAHLRIQAARAKEFDAPVTRTSWSLDPANRTLRVEIELPTATELRPGMYAYATFTIDHADAWCVPASSLIVKDDGHYLYRIEQGKAWLTPVRIGLRDGDAVEILKKQTRLSAGSAWDDIKGTEALVLTNPTALTDGQPIAIPVEQE
jgi:RND family efflux transporter MFP subunit